MNFTLKKAFAVILSAAMLLLGMVFLCAAPVSAAQKKLIHFLTEHAPALVIAAIAAVSLILIIIIFTLASSGSSDRKLSIKDISGSAFILRSDGQIPADKNTVLESGDVIITSSDGEVKLAADKDKYIFIESDTTLYVNLDRKSVV